MTADEDTPSGFSLERWSRRKLAATRAPASSRPPARTEPAGSAAAPGANAAPAANSTPTTEAVTPTPLPPVESLHYDSDFTPFLQPKVDETLKRQALRKLFEDPRFNVMDGLD